jgi:hypothetical protein
MRSPAPFAEFTELDGMFSLAKAKKIVVSQKLSHNLYVPGDHQVKSFPAVVIPKTLSLDFESSVSGEERDISSRALGSLPSSCANLKLNSQDSAFHLQSNLYLGQHYSVQGLFT